MSNPNLPVNELQYQSFSLDTQLRFMEIEVNRAINCLAPVLGSRTEAGKVLYRRTKIDQYDNDVERFSKFMDMLESASFRNPSKQELVFYFRSLGLSYNKIRKLTGISPNTIAQYKEQIPDLVPVYPYWEVPSVDAWKEINRKFNLWNEEVVHYAI